MSKLRRTLSIRCSRRSYNTLKENENMSQPPRPDEMGNGDRNEPIRRMTEKCYGKYRPIDDVEVAGTSNFNGHVKTSTPTPIGNIGKKQQRLQSVQISNRKAATSSPTHSCVDTSVDINDVPHSHTSSKKRESLVGMSSVKTAIFSIGQKIKRKNKPFKRIAESPRMHNGAYTVTPRRSERILALNTPSPISLKMYSPFHIETPEMDYSFTRISKRDCLYHYPVLELQSYHHFRKALAEVNESPLVKTPRRMTQKAIKQHKDLAKTLSSAELPTVSGY